MTGFGIFLRLSLMKAVLYDYEKMLMICVLSRPGSDLLSRVLRQSTIGAGAFHGRVRNGIGVQPLRHNHQVGEEHKYEKLVVFRADNKTISV